MERPEGLYEWPRSITVSILAWLGIVGGAMGSLGFLLLLLGTPGGHLPITALAGPPVTLVASLGLRQRRDWARKSYIGVLGLGMLRVLVALPWSGSLATTGVLALITIAIPGLIIAKLCSHDVREEFGAAE